MCIMTRTLFYINACVHFRRYLLQETSTLAPQLLHLNMMFDHKSGYFNGSPNNEAVINNEAVRKTWCSAAETFKTTCKIRIAVVNEARYS